MYIYLQVTLRPPLGVHNHKLHAVGWERCCPIAAGQTTYCRSNGGEGLRFGNARVQIVFYCSFFAYQHVSVRDCVLFNFVLVCCVVFIVYILMNVYTNVYIYINIYIYTCICIPVYICVYIHMYVHTCACIHVHICAHTHVYVA